MSRKLKIVQRVADKSIFTWTEALAKREGFRSGSLTLDDDGNILQLELDQLGFADYQRLPGIPQREKALMAENQALQARLAVYEKSNTATLADSVPLQVVNVDGGVLPSDVGDPSEVKPLDLTDAAPVEEENITFVPEPVMKSTTNLRKMRNEDLIVHAHNIDPTIDIPDDSVKRQLIQICIDLQEKYKAKTKG